MEEYLSIFKAWGEQIVHESPANVKIIFRIALHEGWLDINLEDSFYNAGALISTEGMLTMEALEQSDNGGVYIKAQIIPADEQLDLELKEFQRRFLDRSLNEFLPKAPGKQ